MINVCIGNFSQFVDRVKNRSSVSRHFLQIPVFQNKKNQTQTQTKLAAYSIGIKRFMLTLSVR